MDGAGIRVGGVQPGVGVVAEGLLGGGEHAVSAEDVDEAEDPDEASGGVGSGAFEADKAGQEGRGRVLGASLAGSFGCPVELSARDRYR
jgi:hypothetical protein